MSLPSHNRFAEDPDFNPSGFSQEVSSAEEKLVTTLSFDYTQISASVREILQREFGPNAAIRTDAGSSGDVYVRIVSDRFDGLSDRTKQDMIWEALHQNLKKDSQAVALVLAFGTDQI